MILNTEDFLFNLCMSDLMVAYTFPYNIIIFVNPLPTKQLK